MKQNRYAEGVFQSIFCVSTNHTPNDSMVDAQVATSPMGWELHQDTGGEASPRLFFGPQRLTHTRAPQGWGVWGDSVTRPMRQELTGCVSCIYM